MIYPVVPFPVTLTDT